MTVSSSTKRPPEESTRTCVGCKQSDARAALLRFVVRDEAPRLVPDVRRRLPGRGVSVHPRRDCLNRAVTRGGFARALKSNIKLDVDEVCALARGQYERRLEGLLSSANRQGALMVGADHTKRAIDEGRAHLVVVARDAAARHDELWERAERAGSRMVFGTKDSLGALVGRAEVAALAIPNLGIAREVAATMSTVTNLSEGE